MWRFCALVLCVFVCLAFAIPAAAQEATPEPAPVFDAAAVERVIEQVRDDLERSRAHAEDASRYASDASNFLSIFEAFGVVITIAAAALGVFGARQLFQTRADMKRMHSEERDELDLALARFTDEIRQKQSDIDQLAKQMIDNAQKQQNELARDRVRFEAELNRKEQEVTDLNVQLRAQAASQREDARKTALALSLLPLGERQYRMQDYHGALATYERALELDEDNPIVHYRLGYIHFQVGNIESAENCLKRSLEIELDFAPAMAALGYIHRRQAEKMLEGVDRELLMNLAERMLLTALKASPTLMDEDGESWWGSLGGLYRRRNQTEQAIAAYQAAARVTPFSSYPFSNLALLYSDRHDKASMLKAYERVERLARDEALAEVGNYYGYADLLTARLALGKVSDAEDALSSVFYTAPSIYALHSLIETLERLIERMGGDDELPYVAAFMPRIRAEISRREQGTPAENVIW
ncbi:MAG: tetratricopeptide repeat protein [Chloroflexota bacterium]|nr:tetratricopeptide repeat protein [Chloroflexota bacterium]